MAYRGSSHWFAGPVHIDFNLTNRCNLACRHCHASSGRALAAELDTAEVLRIVDSLHDLGVLSIAFAGGEPFVRPDVAEILQHATMLPGLSVSVITNGLSLTKPLLAKLESIKADLTINVSIEGSTAVNFGRLRRSASGSRAASAQFFERIKQNIRALVAEGFTVSTNMTITRQSLNDIVATHELSVAELGASALVAIKFFPGGYGSALAHTLEPPVSAWLDVFAELTRSKLAGDLPGLQVSVPAGWEFYLPLIVADLDIAASERAWGYAATAREVSSNHLGDIGDGAGLAELCIDSDGKVYPSVLLAGEPDALAGDLRQATLASIWRDSAVLHRLRQLTVSDIEGACQLCALKKLCGGGSRARAFALTGRLSGPDATCPLVGQPNNAVTRDEMRRITPTIPMVRRIWTVGRGRHAMRVLRLDRGCEVRTSGHVWHCPESTAVALETAEIDEASDLALALRRETAGGGPCPQRLGKILAAAAVAAATKDVARL
ncbi:radical SAM protein [Sinorhizobium medicae]|nr:radical SAM protein [Sinorhizobium medicae]MDX0747660.1 radical SAM protein [Sinorhizobium medicae]